MTKPFSMVEMIKEKRNGQAHAPETLATFVKKLVAQELPDYQVASWLMAVVWRGMTIEETTELTRLVAESGDVLDLAGIPGPTVDKHSTGGVGDKVTLVFAPLLAACGATVAKLSGRGLGHTGGTLDKLEAIPGFRTSLSEDEFKSQLRTVRAAVAGQTQDLAPADGILYALRDVTCTVESVPLIAVSVLSKKIAAGSDAILLDVKAGAGAFMPDVESAEELSRVMLEVGRRLGKKVICCVTGMDQPLGKSIGHANEVAEAIATLRGQGPADLTELCIRMGALLLVAGGLVATPEAGEERLRQAIADGSALDKLRELIEAQGGDSGVINDPLLMPQPRTVVRILAPTTGHVQHIDAMGIALAAKALGGGREKKGDPIDLAVGVNLIMKEGDFVREGYPIAELLVNDESRVERARDLVAGAFRLGPDKPTPRPLIKSVLGPEPVAAAV